MTMLYAWQLPPSGGSPLEIGILVFFECLSKQYWAEKFKLSEHFVAIFEELIDFFQRWL